VKKIQRQREAFAYRIAGSGRYDVQLNIKDGSHPPGSIGRFDIGNDARAAAHKWAGENGLTLDAPGGGPESMGRSPEVWTARRNGEWVGNVQILHDDLAGSAGNPGGPRPDMYSYAAKQAMGDCYETAGRYMLDNGLSGKNPNIKLVHGEVSGQGPLQGKTFGHAWIEDGDNIIDNSNGRHITMPKSEYYHIGNISNTRSYSPDQARENFLKYEHFGPWDDFTPTGKNYVDSDSVKKKKAAFYRIAAVTQDLVDNLDEQFHDWYADQAAQNPTGMPDYDPVQGPIGNWANIESFMKLKYPEAYRGLRSGLEEAAPLLDGGQPPDFVQKWKASHPEYQPSSEPYASGNKAMKAYGYDPAEIAAGMLLLHNHSHPFRGDMAADDQERLNDIAQKRHKMQRNYEQRTKAVAKVANFQDELNGILKGRTDIADLNVNEKQQLSDLFQKWSGGANFAPIHPTGKWYHVSPHDMPEGTTLVPGGVTGTPTSQSFYDMGFGDDTGTLKDMGKSRTQHVWLTPDLEDAHFWSNVLKAPHIYEVEPGDEPQAWNGTGVDGYVSGGAKILRKLSGGDPVKEAAAAIKEAQAVLGNNVYRGIGLAKGDLPPEMEQRLDQALSGTSDLTLGNDLLDYLGKGGLGNDWANQKGGAGGPREYSWYAGQEPNSKPADYYTMLSGDWNGEGDEYANDPDEMYGGMYHHIHGPVRVHDMEVTQGRGNPFSNTVTPHVDFGYNRNVEAMRQAGWNDAVDHLVGDGGRLHGPWSRFTDWGNRMEPKFDSAERVWSHGQDKAWDNGMGDSSMMGNSPQLETIRNTDVHDDKPHNYDPYKSEDYDDSSDWRSNADAITNQDDHFQLRKFQNEPGVPKPLGLALDALRPSVALQALPGIPAMEEEHYQRKHNEDGDPDTEEGQSLNDGVFLGLTDLETMLPL
jgi:hypothetical protein